MRREGVRECRPPVERVCSKLEMIFLDLGKGAPYVGLVLDGHDTVIMAPPVVGYMLEWSRARVLAFAEFKGWRVVERE